MSNFKVKLSKTYEFEGSRISEVDLTGIENLTADDMIRAQQALTMQNHVAVQLESDPKYCMMIAAYASELPSEFFYKLSIKDATKVKNTVSAYFFASEPEE